MATLRAKSAQQLPTGVTCCDEENKNGLSISLAEIENKLVLVSRILPLSQTALEVFHMASSSGFSAQQIAVVLERDASLAAEVLQLANCSFYNPSAEKIVALDKAVTRIGQSRVGEVALATNALTALTSRLLPWMDVGLAWRRSIAAGVAVKLLVAQGGHRSIEQGLLLTAIMHSLGRVILGTLYSRQYESMIAACQERSQPLVEQEKWVFPENHAKVMARLLALWNIPPDAYHPLKYVLDEYPSLMRLSEPTRTKVELTKLAVVIGHIVAGSWEDWDVVEFPPTPLLKRLGIHCVATIIEQTKADVQGILDNETQASGRKESVRDISQPKPLSRQITYCNLSEQTFDFFAELLPSMGIRLKACPADACNFDENVLINCIGAPPEQLAVRVNQGKIRGVTVVSDPEGLEEFGQFGRSVLVPSCYAELRSVCWDASSKLHQNANTPINKNTPTNKVKYRLSLSG